MHKGTSLLIPTVLRAGLLKALHSGHPGVMAMVMRAKETFWWPSLKGDIVQVRAKCLLCNQNVPSQAKEPSMGVPSTHYAINQALLAHANIPCKTQKLSPEQLAFGRTLKDCFPRYVESLTLIPGKLLFAEVKNKMQSKIGAASGRCLEEHTKV